MAWQLGFSNKIALAFDQKISERQEKNNGKAAFSGGEFLGGDDF
ncbi:MAG: hypothetical protein Q8P67_14975 [archaeon]|nr:hypothetical protein [archaeon]